MLICKHSLQSFPHKIIARKILMGFVSTWFGMVLWRQWSEYIWILYHNLFLFEITIQLTQTGALFLSETLNSYLSHSKNYERISITAICGSRHVDSQVKITINPIKLNNLNIFRMIPIFFWVERNKYNKRIERRGFVAPPPSIKAFTQGWLLLIRDLCSRYSDRQPNFQQFFFKFFDNSVIIITYYSQKQKNMNFFWFTLLSMAIDLRIPLKFILLCFWNTQLLHSLCRNKEKHNDKTQFCYDKQMFTFLDR